MEAPPENFAYTLLLSPDFSQPDALAVIDAITAAGAQQDRVEWFRQTFLRTLSPANAGLSLCPITPAVPRHSRGSVSASRTG
jgi:hypothetical protein